jgi:DNA-binding MarR family transcriptional regulator
MRPGRGQLVEQTLEQCSRTFHTFSRTTAAEWLHLDLSMAQLKALFLLMHEQPLTIGTLADRLGIGMSAGSHLVDRLVQEELVERSEDPANRRRTLLRLTPSAEALVTRLQQGRTEQLRRCLRRMEEEDLGGLLRGLHALDVAAHAEQEGDRAAS